MKKQEVKKQEAKKEAKKTARKIKEAKQIVVQATSAKNTDKEQVSEGDLAILRKLAEYNEACRTYRELLCRPADLQRLSKAGYVDYIHEKARRGWWLTPAGKVAIA